MTDLSRIAEISLEKFGAPQEVSAALERLRDELLSAIGADFAGLVLYGGLARGRYRAGKSDVNIVVLLRDTSGDTLAKIAAPLRAAWRVARIEPFILNPAEIGRAADVFPTKLLDIQSHHVMLMGEDPFAGFEIDREHIRLRIEAELRNLLYRLRRRYIAVFDDSVSLASALTNMTVALKIQLEVLLKLTGKDEPADSNTATVFAAAATAFDLDRETLTQLAALRRDEQPPAELTKLYNRVLAVLERAAEIADKLGGAQ